MSDFVDVFAARSDAGKSASPGIQRSMATKMLQYTERVERQQPPTITYERVPVRKTPERRGRMVPEPEPKIPGIMVPEPPPRMPRLPGGRQIIPQPVPLGRGVPAFFAPDVRPGIGKKRQEPYEVFFGVSLGGFDTENFDAISVNPSMQFYKVNLGQTRRETIYVVPANYVFRMTTFYPKHVTSQSRADLKLKLLIGNRVIFQSGHITAQTTGTTVEAVLIEEFRPNGIDGYPFPDVVANALSTGYHDNYPPATRMFGLGFENDQVIIEIENQSDVYDHTIGILIAGWSFPAKGRSKCEIYKSLID